MPDTNGVTAVRAQMISARQPLLASLLIGLLIPGVLAACSPAAAPTAPPSPSQAIPTPTIQSPAATATPNVTPTLTPAPTPVEAVLPDPCVLVTKDEAAAAVGNALADGSSELFSRTDGTTGRNCYYDAVSGPGVLNVNIWRATPEQAALYKQEKMMFGDVEDVAGVGDSAYRVGWNELVVQQGEYVLEYGIEMVNYHPDTAQANLRTLALTSISRL